MSGAGHTRLEAVRQHISAHDGAPGLTVKIDIGEHDVYVKLVWFDGEIVRIDATVSAGGAQSDEQLQPLEASRYDIVRMWIESECQLASDLLASGAVSIEYLIEWWKGRRGWPSGYSRKLEFVNPGGMLQPMPCAGPFDAIAKLIEQRIDRWRMELTNVESVDTLTGQDTAEDGGGGHDGSDQDRGESAGGDRGEGG